MELPVEDIERVEDELGELLIDRGKLDRAGLERAKRLREGQSERLYQLLPKLGLASERDVAQAIADRLELPLVASNDIPHLPLLEDKLSPRFLREARILPLAEKPEGLVLAMADPLDSYAADAMRLISGCELLLRVAEPAVLESAIERLYGKGRMRQMTRSRSEKSWATKGSRSTLSALRTWLAKPR